MNNLSNILKDKSKNVQIYKNIKKTNNNDDYVFNNLKENIENIQNKEDKKYLDKGFIINNSRNNIEDSSNYNHKTKMQTDKMVKITQKLESIKKNSNSEKNLANNSSW